MRYAHSLVVPTTLLLNTYLHFIFHYVIVLLMRDTFSMVVKTRTPLRVSAISESKTIPLIGTFHMDVICFTHLTCLMITCLEDHCDCKRL